MKEEIQPVPCSRVRQGKKCGKLPRIIHPWPDLYYAICTCREHNQHFGKYQFLGTTKEKAIRRWNEFHLYGVDHTEEMIDKIAKALNYTQEQKNEFKTRNRNVDPKHKNSRGQLRPKHYSPNH